MPSVFISYSRDDQDRADRLERHLLSCGIKVEMDRIHALPGEDLMSRLYRLVQDNDLALVLISPASVQSDYVKAEAIFGLGAEERTGRLRVIPLVIEKCGSADDWFEKLVPKWLQSRIVDDISGWIGQESPSPEDPTFQRILRTIQGHALPAPHWRWKSLAWTAAAVVIVSFLWPILDMGAGMQRVRLAVRAVAFGTYVALFLRLLLWTFRSFLRLSQHAWLVSGIVGILIFFASLFAWPIQAIDPPRVEKVTTFIEGEELAVHVAFAPVSLRRGHQLYLGAWQVEPYESVVWQPDLVDDPTQRQAGFRTARRKGAARGYLRLLIYDAEGEVLVRSPPAAWSCP